MAARLLDLAGLRAIFHEGGLFPSYHTFVLLVGYGSKSQLANVDQALVSADLAVKHLNEQFGDGKWVALFGGDPYNTDKPDIAVICKHIQDKV
jgi:hypothetical protein